MVGDQNNHYRLSMKKEQLFQDGSWNNSALVNMEADILKKEAQRHST